MVFSMSSSKANTWSTKCQSSNGLKVTLVKKRKSSPEKNDVGVLSAEEIKPTDQTLGLAGPRWTIASNKNPCKLVIKRRKTNDYPDCCKDACSSGEPSLKMRIVASTKTSQDSETTFLRVKSWCKPYVSNSASVALCDSYLASDLQSSQPSPKCSVLEGCLSAELFHLQPSPKDSGIDVSSPPRRLDEIHVADVSGCVAMATISESAAASISNATSMVVSDVVMAMFSNAECANQDGMLHGVKHGVRKNALKTGEARACGEVLSQLGGRTTRRLSNLQSLCSSASPKALSAPEEERIMLRLPSSMFRATVAGNTRTKNSSASSIVAGVRSSKRIASFTSKETDAPGISKKMANSNLMSQSLATGMNSKDPDCPKITSMTGSNNQLSSSFVGESKSKTKTNLVVGEEINSQYPDVTGRVKGMDQTVPVSTAVKITKTTRLTKEKNSKHQIRLNASLSNIITAKMYPNISLENRSKDQSDPSITEKVKNNDQTDPSVTEKDQSQDQTVAEKDRSEDRTVAERDRSEDRTVAENDQSEDRTVAEKDRSEDRTVAEKDRSEDRTVAEKNRSEDETNPSFTEKDVVMEHTAPSITWESCSNDQLTPIITGRKRGKSHVGANITGKLRKQKLVGPTHVAAMSFKDPAEQSHAKEKCQGHRSSSVLGDIKTKGRSPLSVEINSKNSVVSDESRNKDQLSPRIFTAKKKYQGQSSPSVLGDIKTKGRSFPVNVKMSSKDSTVNDESKDQFSPRIGSTKKKCQGQSSPSVLGDIKTKGRSSPVSVEMNSKDSTVSDESQNKNQFSPRIGTTKGDSTVSDESQSKDPFSPRIGSTKKKFQGQSSSSVLGDIKTKGRSFPVNVKMSSKDSTVNDESKDQFSPRIGSTKKKIQGQSSSSVLGDIKTKGRSFPVNVKMSSKDSTVNDES